MSGGLSTDNQITMALWWLFIHGNLDLMLLQCTMKL